jgi:Xaa-Pro aminopeptidase
MRADIDEEMRRRDLDWLILSGPRICNPDIIYMIGRASILLPIIVKKRGADFTVIHNSMERGEVARWSLKGIDSEDIMTREELKSPGALSRGSAFYQRLFEHMGVSGRVAFYGCDDIHRSFFVLQDLQRSNPSLEIVADLHRSVFQMARETKDARELDLMRDVAEKTCALFEELFAFIRRGRIKGERLVDEEGAPLKLGDLRRMTAIGMARQNLAAAETPIISMGRDAAFPHSLGNDEDELTAGKSIILDIFPRSLSTGYVCDVTRTICIGPAPEPMKKLHEAVMEARDIAMEHLRMGEHFSMPDLRVSEYFDRRGYPTLWKDPRAVEGYAHSVGHGIGLQLHERPRMSVFNRDVEECAFKPGMVLTVEPGLYSLADEMGIRIEDAIILGEDGALEILSPLPRGLEIIPEG